MKTGVELIAAERQEQIEKHRRTVPYDLINNFEYQLSQAASLLACEDWDKATEIADSCPSDWDRKVWERMSKKPYKDRLIIAGALIAAEIDRLNYNEL